MKKLIIASFIITLLGSLSEAGFAQQEVGLGGAGAGSGIYYPPKIKTEVEKGAEVLVKVKKSDGYDACFLTVQKLKRGEYLWKLFLQRNYNNENSVTLIASGLNAYDVMQKSHNCSNQSAILSAIRDYLKSSRKN